MTDAIRFERDGWITRGDVVLGIVERDPPGWSLRLVGIVGSSTHPTLRAAKAAARALLEQPA